MQIKCSYHDRCHSKNDSKKCAKCTHNTMRNFIEDFFEEANDNPMPEKCPRLTYSGPAEQTAGYKCPVCGHYTNPYVMTKNLCGGCGYRLNCG